MCEENGMLNYFWSEYELAIRNFLKGGLAIHIKKSYKECKFSLLILIFSHLM